MAGAIMRRNSSKKGLQNLMKVMAQRSIEDAEEVERERRRRARESFRRTNSNPGPEESSPGSEITAEDCIYDDNLKSAGSPSLEEDEGFSDWTQRREKRRQQRMQELSQGAEEEQEEKALNGTAMDSVNRRVDPGSNSVSRVTSSNRLQKQQRQQEETELPNMESKRTTENDQEPLGVERAWKKTGKERAEQEHRRREEEMRPSKMRGEDSGPEAEVENRTPMKVSYTSKVFLQQETKHGNPNGEEDRVGLSSCIKTKRTVSLPGVEQDEAEAILETEQRLERIHRTHQEKESQELEQLRNRQMEAEQELEELKRRREERRRLREEEERRKEEEEQQRLAKEEEEKKRMKEDIERRRLEAAERMKTLSTSSVEGDEMFSPVSPRGSAQKKANEEGLTTELSCSITERTESLNRSLKKSNSFKKTQPPLMLSKIDDKLEQYTHAIENSQETKATKLGLMDIPSSPEAVALKKSLFESGEASIHSPIKGTPCKDTEGLKVGVAGLITQWVKGTPDSNGKQSPTRPADVKPGGVMQKRNMWEIIGESGRTGQRPRGTSSTRYKFVVTGHGKYEKIPVDDLNTDEYSNGKSDLCHGDY